VVSSSTIAVGRSGFHHLGGGTAKVCLAGGLFSCQGIMKQGVLQFALVFNAIV